MNKNHIIRNETFIMLARLKKCGIDIPDVAVMADNIAKNIYKKLEHKKK